MIYDFDDLGDAGLIADYQHKAGSQYGRLARAYSLGDRRPSICWHPTPTTTTILTEQRHCLAELFRGVNSALEQSGRLPCAVTSRMAVHGWRCGLEHVPPLKTGLDAIAAYIWGKEMQITLAGSELMRVTAERMRQEAANDNGPPVRDTSSPFSRMHAKGQLDPDSGINGILFDAGQRYYADWYMAGLQGLSGIDYGRVGSGGEVSPAHYMPVSERQAERRAKHRAARAALGDRYAAVVEPIVLHDQQLAVTAAASEYKNPNGANAVTKERLNVGLRRLAVHYGFMRAP